MMIVAGVTSYVPGAASICSQHRSPSVTSNFAVDTASLAQPVATDPTSSASLLSDEALRSVLESSAAPAAGDPRAGTIAVGDPREVWEEFLARELWATIEVKGEVVAYVFRSGGCSIDSKWPVPADFSWDGEGIELAKRRAYQLAKFYDGTINGMDPDEARQSWLDMSELENAIGSKAGEDQSPKVRLAVPTEAITPSLAT